MALNGCSCYGAWAAIFPPPPCAVHGPRPYYPQAMHGDPSKFSDGQIPARPVFEVGVKTVDTVARFKFDQKTGQYEPYFPCGYDERDAKV